MIFTIVDQSALIYQFTILIVFILALIFFIIMYRYSLELKASIQQEEEAKQQLIINELKLEKSELENSKLESERQIGIEKNLRLEQEVVLKNKELVTNTLMISKQNDLIAKIEKELKTFSQEKNNTKSSINKIGKIIRSNSNLANDWDQFKLHFEKVHPTFFESLMTSHSNLSPNDLKHCAYVKMGLSTKEIARLLNINPTSVQMNRVRLKKKMELTRETDLIGYITKL